MAAWRSERPGLARTDRIHRAGVVDRGNVWSCESGWDNGRELGSFESLRDSLERFRASRSSDTWLWCNDTTVSKVVTRRGVRAHLWGLNGLEEVVGVVHRAVGVASGGGDVRKMSTLTREARGRGNKHTPALFRDLTAHARDTRGAGARGGDDSSGHLWQSLDAMSGGLVRSRR